MTRARIAATHVVLPLVLGALSYFALRSCVPFWPAHVAWWRAAPGPLRDHFADAAWGWALGGFVSVVWLGERASRRRAWVAIAALVAAVVEYLQYAHILNGVFDPVDLVVQAGAVIAASVVVGEQRTWIDVPV